MKSFLETQRKYWIPYNTVYFIVLLFFYIFLGSISALPLIVFALMFIFQLYTLKGNINKQSIIVIAWVGFFFFISSALGTDAISEKCASEINKPAEIRDNTKIEAEVKNFETCLNSITFWDKIVYGLIK